MIKNQLETPQFHFENVPVSHPFRNDSPWCLALHAGSFVAGIVIVMLQWWCWTYAAIMMTNMINVKSSKLLFIQQHTQWWVQECEEWWPWCFLIHFEYVWIWRLFNQPPNMMFYTMGFWWVSLFSRTGGGTVQRVISQTMVGYIPIESHWEVS